MQYKNKYVTMFYKQVFEIVWITESVNWIWTICLLFLPYCLETTTLSEPICDWLGNRRMIDCIMILFSKFTRFLFCHDLLLQMMLVWLMLTFVQLRLRGLIRASLPLCGHYSELKEIKPSKSDTLHFSAICHTNYLHTFFQLI